MGRRLRIFISSTMDDLANERSEVVRRIRTLNFDPVNAEDWSPDGTGSWTRIEKELRGSDIFVLILGSRYGWIPDAGPKTPTTKSVTHLEYEEARKCGLPILVFSKRSGADDDGMKAFKREVSSWDEGLFRAEFELARDLADGVASAVVSMLADHWSEIRDRASASDPVEPDAAPTTDDVRLPVGMLSAVQQRKAVLLAGAGISIPVGYPSAVAWCLWLSRTIQRRVPSYAMEPGAHRVRRIAEDLEFLEGRGALVDEVRRLMEAPASITPTTGHRLAIRLFDTIVTTNFDPLFERAAREEGVDTVILDEEFDAQSLPQRAIVKLVGSISRPESLLLTERDLEHQSDGRRRLWDATRRRLAEQTVIAVGTSLDGEGPQRLLGDRAAQHSGYYVVPTLDGAKEVAAQRLGLEPITATADALLDALAQVVLPAGE